MYRRNPGKFPHNDKRRPPWFVSVFMQWTRHGNHSGNGKFWKRQLSKVRRRAWKDERHPRGLAGMESTVNYKTW